MAIQRRSETNISNIGAGGSNTQSATDLKGWRILQPMLGYLATEAKVGSPLNIMMGLNNVSDLDLTLQFVSSQRIQIVIYDAGQQAVYQTPANRNSTPAQEIVKAIAGAHWTETVQLNGPPFKTGGLYVIAAKLMATNLPLLVSAPLQLQ